MKHTVKSILYILLCSFAVIILLYPDASQNAITNSIKSTVMSVVPSLFPFMVISALLCDLPMPKFLNSLMKPICKLLKLNREYASSIILGNICGFPIGALTASKITENYGINKHEALRAVILSNNVSISFALTYVASTVKGGRKTALILWVCQFTSAICVCFISSAVQKTNFQLQVKPKTVSIGYSFTQSFTNAVGKAAQNSLNVASFICFFSVLSVYITNTGKALGAKYLSFTADILLEISTACKKTSEVPFPHSAVICAFCMGFSCICVIFQSAVFIKNCGVSVGAFTALKFFQGILSASFATIILQFINPEEKAVEVSISPITQLPIITISLCFLAVYFYIILKEMPRST